MIFPEKTGKVTGQVAVCLYDQEPAGTPHFGDSVGDGGMDAKGIKFILIRVDGFQQGIAHVELAYQQTELGDIDPNSLFLASKEENAWIKLTKLSVQTGAQVVKGDKDVTSLINGSVIGLGGGGPGAGQSTAAGLSLGDIWPFVAAACVLIGVLLFLLLRRSAGSRRMARS